MEDAMKKIWILGLLLSIVCSTGAYAKVEFIKPDKETVDITENVVSTKIKSANLTLLGIYFCHINCDFFEPYYKNITLDTEKTVNISHSMTGILERNREKFKVYEKDNFDLSFSLDLSLIQPTDEKKYGVTFIPVNLDNGKTHFSSRYSKYNYGDPLPHYEIWEYQPKEFGPYKSDSKFGRIGFKAICGSSKDYNNFPAVLAPYSQNLVAFHSGDIDKGSFHIRGNYLTVDGKIDQSRIDVSGFFFEIYAVVNSITFTDGSVRNFNTTSIEEKKWMALKDDSKYSLKRIIPWQGEGTENNPYLIKSYSDLLALTDGEDYINGNYYFKQTEDINVSDVQSWGAFKDNVILFHYDQLIFNGHYDGNNKKITGLKFVDTLSNDKTIPENKKKEMRGLFRFCRNAEIKNLTLECDIDAKESIEVGGLTGKAENSTFSNIMIKGKITGKENVGALMGSGKGCKLANINTSVTLKGLKNIGGVVGLASNVEFNNINVVKSEITGEEYVGGITGSMSDNSRISNSNVSAVVTAKFDPSISKKEKSRKKSYCGGVAGHVKEGCHASSVSVSGKITSETSSGGFAGNITANKKPDASPDKYENIVNSAEINATNGSAGGVSGEALNNIFITGCVNQGTIQGLKAGGIAGVLWGCYDSYKKAEMTAVVQSCANHGKVETTEQIKCYVAGGIVGNLKFYSKILDCYSDGAISSLERCGGIVGECNGYVSNCYGIGELKTKKDNRNIGGVAGYLWWSGPTKNKRIIIENCFSTPDAKITCGEKNPMGRKSDKVVPAEVAQDGIVGKNNYFASASSIELNSTWKPEFWEVTKGKYPVLLSEKKAYVHKAFTAETKFAEKVESQPKTDNPPQEKVLSEEEAPRIVPQILELEP